MTTENTRSEHNDWQEPVVEQFSASETSTLPTVASASFAEEQTPEPEAQPGLTSPEAATEDERPALEPGVEQQGAHHEEYPSVLFSSAQEILSESEQEASIDGIFPIDLLDVVSSEQFSPVAEVPTPELSENGTSAFASQETETSMSTGEFVRPFTDFIEEFRQTEVHLNSLLQESEISSGAFLAENEGLAQEAITPTTPAASELTIADLIAGIQSEPIEKPAESESVARSTEEMQSGLTQPTLSAERPVSPLLRPATRLRLPRHGRQRIEELIQPAKLYVEPAKAVVEPPTEEQPESEKTQTEEQAARPARRYRFDRPAAPTAPLAPAKSGRGVEIKEKKSVAFVAPTESVTRADVVTAHPATNGVVAPEAPAQKAPLPEQVPAASIEAPVAPTTERRRRSSHERQRDKEQPAMPVTPPQETPAPEVEVVVAALDLPAEELPPLEYAELQAANSRRRRRRRAGSASIPASVSPIATPKAALPEIPLPVPTPMPAPVPSTAAIALPKATPAAPVAPVGANSNYNIVSGYTVSQMNQGNDASGPFMGPEPSPARGSTFSSTSSQIRPVRNDVSLRTPAHTTKHVVDPLMTPAAVNHLANTVSQAIQTQTDRMVSELRRANQVPTNISVSLPPFPSNERVGVFVDVANLLYSARTLRMTVDFGKLLDFLRGNRRLVRAQAYCPTSPQPGDDQMFLQAVKGLGYRITTKNYKTFSSGAKKADLDLDLCMDVVRLVDGKAVDCIVLVSGDSDFMPMLDYCSDHGVRVEVAAFDESMSATLRQGCDLFVNLSMLEEIRA